MGVREKWSLRYVVGPRSIHNTRDRLILVVKFVCATRRRRKNRKKNRKTETQTKVRMAKNVGQTLGRIATLLFCLL